MHRRDLVQMFSVGLLTGGSFACSPSGTARNSLDASNNPISALTKQELDYLALAIGLSDLSSTPLYGENEPFGAVIVFKDGRVFDGYNHVRVDKDPTQHAELYTVSHAFRTGFQRRDFEDSTLYTSTEPCAMCCGAIYWAGIRRVVFACAHESLDRLFRDMFPKSPEGGGLLMSSRDIFAKGATRTDVLGPYLEEQAVAVHKKHWPRLLGVAVPPAWNLHA